MSLTKAEIEKILLDRKIENIEAEIRRMKQFSEIHARNLGTLQAQVRHLRPKDVSKTPYIEKFVSLDQWETFLQTGVPLGKQPEIGFDLKYPNEKTCICHGFQELFKRILTYTDQNLKMKISDPAEKPLYSNGKKFRKPFYCKKSKRYFELDQTPGKIMLEIYSLNIETQLYRQNKNFQIRSAVEK